MTVRILLQISLELLTAIAVLDRFPEGEFESDPDLG